MFIGIFFLSLHVRKIVNYKSQIVNKLDASSKVKYSL